uniref:1-Cys peroxiredoxin n=1 Tax=Bemisia tabaci TaxID=7038 RepID=A0A7S5HGI6_BEMTA|nr:peroxiredoxin-6-like protein [Bemisia tabaci]
MRLEAIIPDFPANTTHGPINFYDFAGDSWVVLFSHPADFTPVCTTELGRMAVHLPEFEKRNVKLLALSCDKLETHTDWVNDIKSYCQDIPGEFPYPIISDESRELAVKLDMLNEADRENPDTAMTVRALYVISPDKRLRLSMVYPTSTGRNVDELLRVIDSLQLHDRLKVIATPANWVPGDKVMILPSVTDEQIQELFPEGAVDSVSMPSGKCYVRTTTKY